MSSDRRMGALATDLASEHCRHVVLDFDQTLFLDNSTERYLDALRPRLLAFLVVTCCDWLLQCLAWFGALHYNHQRDFVRVMACTALMPWNFWLWRRRAQRLVVTSMNYPLLEALPPGREVIVLSYGFQHIIQPLLQAAGLTEAQMVCSRTGLPPVNLRSRGKCAALAGVLPPQAWEDTVFVTDSEDDAEVIEAIPRSYVVQWGASPVPAFTGWYLPLRYTVEAKYPDSRYFTYQIVLEDLAVLWLAYAFSWNAVFAVWWLFLSLYTIYEIGHYDNDHLATAYETRPRVSEKAKRHVPLPGARPWLWAVLFALIGIAFARPEYSRLFWAMKWLFLVDLACWLALLGGLFVVFRAFNCRPPEKRLFLFPVLHAFKTFTFVMFLPLKVVGALLLAAQVISISCNYVVYRRGGDTARFNRQAVRLALFLVLAGVVALFMPAQVLGAGRVRWLLILVWGGIRSVEQAQHKNILRIIGEHGKEIVQYVQRKR